MAVQSRGVDLDIVQVLTGNAVAQGHGDGIPVMWGSWWSFIQPADAAAGQHHRPCPDGTRFAVRAGSNDTAASRGVGEEIQQSRMLAQFDVLAAQDLVQQGLGDLVAGNILMEQNARAGVRSSRVKRRAPWSSRAKRTPRRTRSRMIELEERIIRSTVAGLFS